MRVAYWLETLCALSGISRRGRQVRQRRRVTSSQLERLEDRVVLANWVGDIPNGTVWPAGQVQRITGDVRIPLGSTLTIQPGAVIKFNNNSDIDFLVDGTLLAQGTAAQPIVFTELRDDTGGDTNGDGTASGPARSNWGALIVRPGSTGSILDHFELRYGGWRADAELVVNGGQLTFNNGVVRDADGYGVRITNASPTLTNISYVRNPLAAISMDLNSAPVISGVTMTNNGWNGLWMDPGTLPGNATWNNPDIVYILPDNVTVPQGKTLTLGAGQIIKTGFRTELSVNGTLLANGTAASPVIFANPSDDTAGGDTNNNGPTNVNNDASGGIVFSVTSTDSVLDHVEVRNSGYNVGAAIVVNSAPITVTNSVFINSVNAGISLNSSTAVITGTVFQNSTWEAINATLSSILTINGNTYSSNGINGLLMRGGSLVADATWNSPDTVYWLQDDVTVPQGKTLTIGAGQIVKTGFRTELFVNGTLNVNGTAAQPAIFASLSDDTAGGDTNNNGPTNPVNDPSGGIVFSVTSTGSVLDHVEVRHSGYDDNAAIMVNGASITLTNSVIRDAVHAGIWMNAGTMTLSNTDFDRNTWLAIAADVASNITSGGGNTFSHSPVNGVVVLSGSLPASTTWNNPDITYVLDGNGAGVTIPVGVTLTLGAGQIVKVTNRREAFIVNGTLKALGTAADPVICTSFDDDSVGGDSNNNGTSSGPNYADWGGFQFLASSTGNILDYVQVRYGGSNGPVLSVKGSPLTLTNSTVSYANAGGLRVEGSTPVIADVTFLNNHGAAIALGVTGDVQSSDITATGNGVNAIVVDGGTMSANQTWSGQDLNYQLGGNLTISPGATLTIANGTVFDAMEGVSLSGAGSISNTGTIRKLTGISTATIGPAVLNSGTIRVASGTLNLAGGVADNGNGVLTGPIGTTLGIGKNLSGNTQNAAGFAPLATVTFNGSGTAAAPQLLEALSADKGSLPAGFDDNFAFYALSLANGTYVRLVDNANNITGNGSEAVYTQSLVVPSGTTLDLNGLHLYTRSATISGTVTGGTVSVLPDGGPLILDLITPGKIAATGEIDDWTIFGRAGQTLTITLGTGAGSLTPPTSPTLNFGQVQLIGPGNVILGTASNSVTGTEVSLAGITLPSDGTYHIKIQAPAAQTGSTGNYVLTAWNATINTHPVELNQAVTGDIDKPFRIDRWTFSASANQVLNFRLINVENSNVQFDLTGPNGFTAFSNQSNSLENITLAQAGVYSLTVHTTQRQTGAYAFRLESVSVTNLALGATFNGPLASGTQSQLFKVTVANLQQLQVLLTDTSLADHNEVYVKLGSAPTRSDSQYKFSTPASANQQVTVPSAAPGDWYVLVYSESAQQPGNISLQVKGGSVFLNDVTPDHAGNGANMTLRVTGVGFDNSTAVSLISASNAVYSANTASIDLSTQITETFNAGQVPAGTYSVRVNKSDGSISVLPGAFTVSVGGQAHLVTNVIVPNPIGLHVASTIYVQYSNTGTVAMPAPLLVLAGVQNEVEGALLTLDPALQVSGFWTSATPAGYSQSVQILASGATPGVLGPGESVSVPVYYAGWLQDQWDFSRPPIYFTLGTLTTDSTAPVDWAALKSTLRPSDISSEAWDGIYSNLTTQLGPTWGSVIERLDQDAAYLGALGIHVTDISRLWSFEILLANGISPIPLLAGGVDMFVASAGLPLGISRTFGNSIISRHESGPFGNGWHLNGGWSQALTVAADGTVTISDGGQVRQFQPDSRNSGYFAQAGDRGILASQGSGVYTLTTPSGLVTKFQNGRVTFVEDTNGNRITAGYSGGRLTSLTSSSGQSIALTYNAAGRIISLANSIGQTAQYTYDATNQFLLSATDLDGTTTTYSYNTGSSLQTHNALMLVTNADGTQQVFNYDAQGRVNTVSAAGGALATHFDYGPAGTVMASNSTNDVATYSFDHRGLLAKIVDPLQRATYYKYDANGNLSTATTPEGTTYSYTYDSHGRQIQFTNPLGNVTRYTYGPLDNIASVTDPKHNSISFQYDQNGNLLSTLYADGTVESRAYNPIGEITQSTDGNKHVVNYTYDAGGRLKSTTYADSSQTTYQYDLAGNLTSVVESSGTTTLTYDSKNRLTQVTYPDGAFLKYSYDAAGRRTQMLDQTGFTVNYQFDSLGRLSGLKDGSNNSIVSYMYDVNGRLQQETKGNGSSTVYTYDKASQTLSIVNRAPGGGINSSFVYTYNNLGLNSTETTLQGQWVNTYDATGQLTRAVFTSNNPGAIPNQDLKYFYDAAGNRTQTIENGVTTTYTTNSRNQYTVVGGTTYTYDANGNRITQTDGGGQTRFIYDVKNQLVGIQPPDGATSSYQYDAFGLLLSSSQSGTTSRYLNDAITGAVVGVFDAGGSVVTHNTFAIGLVSQVAASGVASYYDFDLRGSTVGLTNVAGSYLNTYAYTAFGEMLSSVENTTNPFQFVGRWGVQALNGDVTLMGLRTYDAELGRFNSEDPLGLSGGDTNLYRYAFNNAPNLIDPAGTQGIPVGFSFFGTGSAAYGFGLGVHQAFSEAAAAASQTVAEQIRQDAERSGQERWKILRETQSKIFDIQHDPRDSVRGTRNSEISKEYKMYIQGIIILGGGLTGGRPVVNPTSPSGSFNNPTTEIPVRLPAPVPNPPLPTPPADALEPVETTPVNSTDPNELIGPAGFGAEGFVVDQGQPFPYRINFENEPDATAPAQRVTITNQLNTNLDWGTFLLTGAGFGDIMLDIPPGSRYYQTMVPLTYNGVSFVVQITLGIHSATGQVYAIFQSLNLESSLPPDVLTGFLPPEDGTGRGMGFISYIVNVKPGLSTGTQIRNVALITFDTNPAISTDQIDPHDPSLGIDPAKQALNTIDAGSPGSLVTPLPAQSPASFTVNWSGADDAGGSGIATYDIYVSIDGGDFTIWKFGTAATSAIYTGEAGKTYRFYSVAHDNVGHDELAPLTADTLTTVANLPPVIENQSFNVPENSAVNTVVGTVQASGGSTLTYSILSGNSGNNFILDPATGSIKAAAGATLNFEGTHTYTLTVQVTDSGSPSKSNTASITIHVTDVNEAPVIPTGQTYHVAASALAGAVVGTVTANEPDTTGPNSTKTFSLPNGSTIFAINAAGQITVVNAAALVAAAGQTITLQVTDTDGGTSPLSDSESVSITVSPANTAPVLSTPGPGSTFYGNLKTPVKVAPTLTVTDADGAATIATIIVSLPQGAVKKNPDVVTFPGLAAIGTSAVVEASGRRQITITLKPGTTNAAVQTMLDNMTFSTKAKGLKVLSRAFKIEVVDQTGLHSNVITQNVNVAKKAPKPPRH